jgi:hypothetical protein
MSKLQETNIEFLTDWLEYSRTGAMAQLFALQAIDHYSRLVIQNQDRLRVDMAHSMISPESWIAAAQEFQRLYCAKYGPHPVSPDQKPGDSAPESGSA